ncbi:MAG: hypothetical protein N2C14_09805, partial [Planctomycetales bacterium]
TNGASKTKAGKREATVGFWRFNAEDPLADASAGDVRLTASLPMKSKLAKAPSSGLADFCHVLLNSNEFLYVD